MAPLPGGPAAGTAGWARERLDPTASLRAIDIVDSATRDPVEEVRDFEAT